MESNRTGESLEEGKKPNVLKEILKDSVMARNMIGMIMVWTSSAFGYYLISFQLKYVKGDFFANNITSAISELVSYVTSGIIFSCLGLKITFATSYGLAIAGMLSLTLT